MPRRPAGLLHPPWVAYGPLFGGQGGRGGDRRRVEPPAPRRSVGAQSGGPPLGGQRRYGARRHAPAAQGVSALPHGAATAADTGVRGLARRCHAPALVALRQRRAPGPPRAPPA
eukprot:6252800-Alexandrium_andersonii.AAC.1